MRLTDMIPVNPITVPKSLRRIGDRFATTADAGNIIPVAVVPLFREDRLSRGNYTLNIEMRETADLLMNALHVTAYAHFVPFLAFERFNGMDQFNRSYEGVPETEGGSDVIPFFESHPFDNTTFFYKTLGIHGPTSGNVNTAYVEAFNAIVNHRRKARSPKLPQRTRLDTGRASAFWHHTAFSHIVPDFDQAAMDGEIPIRIAAPKAPIEGIWRGSTQISGYAGTMVDPDSGTAGPATANTRPLMVDVNATAPRIFAELDKAGLSISLSSLESIKRTQAFAELRSKYSGIDQEHIIDLLMDGIRVPDEALRQPILLAKNSTRMGYSRRYATDSGNLTENVTSGMTSLDLRMRTNQQMNTGGIVVITLEIVPEQLWERQRDYFLFADTVDKLPDFTRDFLDEEKVAVVQNQHVDVRHSNPTGTFGYAPLNHQWKREMVRIGGEMYRPASDSTFVEARNRIWAAETVDPVLGVDFYLCTNLNKKPFLDSVSHGFEITGNGFFDIVGNTVFGKGLEEDSGDFEALRDETPTDRIVLP